MAARPGQARLTPLAWAALGLAALIMVAPLLWTLLLSLKQNADLVGHSGAALNPPYTPENYGTIFANSLTPPWLLNSAIVALAQPRGVRILASLAGSPSRR